MESNVPYVITIGAVVAGCLIARTCSAATRTLPAENKREPKRLEDRVRVHSSQATSPRSRAIQLQKKVMEHLIKAGQHIGLQQLPFPSDDGEDRLMFCLKELKGRKAAYFERSSGKPVSDEMSKIPSFEQEFNAAIALCVEFFLQEKRFQSALDCGLLAYPDHNHAIVIQLVQPLLVSNALDQAEKVLVKMDPRSQRLDELWLQLGQKHLDRVPAQIEGAKRTLDKVSGEEEKFSFAERIANRCLLIGTFTEGVDIVIGYLPSDENRELLLAQFVEKLIETGQMTKALAIVLTHLPEGERRQRFILSMIDPLIETKKWSEDFDAVVAFMDEGAIKRKYIPCITRGLIKEGLLERALFALENYFPEGEKRHKLILRIIDGLIAAQKWLVALNAVQRHLPMLSAERDAYRRRIAIGCGLLS